MRDIHANKISLSKQYIDSICRRIALRRGMHIACLFVFCRVMARRRLAGTKCRRISNGELGTSCINTTD